MLTDAADGLTTSEYTQMLEDVLGNIESDVVASIAEHMSPDLQALLPKRLKFIQDVPKNVLNRQTH